MDLQIHNYRGNRVLDLDHDKLMFAGDIQGNRKDYEAIKKIFLKLKKKGKVDRLILGGDIIHGYPGYSDESVEILDDIAKLGRNLIIPLLGNHEFVHIYHILLQKGELAFTQKFEAKIEGKRFRYIEFFMDMPFAVRTRGGVFINHSGANASLISLQDQLSVFDFYNKFDHRLVLGEILNTLKAIAQGNPATSKILGKFGDVSIPEETAAQIIDLQVKDLLEGFYPMIGHFFQSTDLGRLTWEIFMNKNEVQYNERYFNMLNNFLSQMSTEQYNNNFILCGHIETPKGFEIVGEKQLRMCPAHENGYDAKAYIILDAAKNYKDMQEIDDNICYYEALKRQEGKPMMRVKIWQTSIYFVICFFFFFTLFALVEGRKTREKIKDLRILEQKLVQKIDSMKEEKEKFKRLSETEQQIARQVEKLEKQNSALQANIDGINEEKKALRELYIHVENEVKRLIQERETYGRNANQLTEKIEVEIAKISREREAYKLASNTLVGEIRTATAKMSKEREAYASAFNKLLRELKMEIAKIMEQAPSGKLERIYEEIYRKQKQILKNMLQSLGIH